MMSCSTKMVSSKPVLKPDWIFVVTVEQMENCVNSTLLKKKNPLMGKVKKAKKESARNRDWCCVHKPTFFVLDQ